MFRFQADWYTDGRSEAIVVKAPKDFVEQFISESELFVMFGGFAEWRASVMPTPEMPGEAIGVWGRRKVARFIRLLRERGADVSVVDGEGPQQLLFRQCRYYGRN